MSKRFFQTIVGITIITLITGCSNQADSTSATRCTEPTSSQVSTTHEHKYIDHLILPSCRTAGYTDHVCECGKKYRSDFIEPTGHEYSDWVEVKEASEDAPGRRERTCKVCGYVDYQITYVDPIIETTVPHPEEIPQESDPTVTTEPVSVPTEPIPQETEPPIIDPEPAPSKPLPPEPEVPEINYETNAGGWRRWTCPLYEVSVIDTRSWGEAPNVSLVSNGLHLEYINKDEETVTYTVTSQKTDGLAVSVYIEEDGTYTVETMGGFH